MNELSNQKILKMINNKELTPEEGLKLYKKLQSNNKNNINEESETVYFEYNWKKVSNLINDTNMNENIVVFSGDTQATKLLNKLKDSNNAVTLVKFGNTYNYEDGNFTIRKNIYEDYNKLVEDLYSNDILPSTIIHIGSSDFVNNQENIEKQLSNIYSLFFTIKALMKQKISNIKYFYIYDNKQNKIQPHHEAVSGFLKTTSMENSNYICKTIELVNSDNKEDLIIKEIANNSTEETEIKYENNNRYIKEINLLDNNSIPNTPLPIKENGVYLITGGAGGLGLIFAKHLAKIKNVNLILTGRSKLTPERDASQKEIKKEYKKIDGIIHSAGIIRDSFILKKEKSEMEQVFAPKINGLINLAYSLKEENLDFFTIFSSLSGITGNIGQSDYAYANCFMDSYARLLKDEQWFEKVISINWPLWKDGGMEVTKKTEERILEEFGLVPMNSECGTKAFEISLKLDDKSQLMVFQGNKDNIINALQKLKRKNEYLNKSTKTNKVDKLAMSLS